MYRSCWYVGMTKALVVLSQLPLAQIWIVVQTGCCGAMESRVAVHLPTACRLGVGCAIVSG